MLATLCILSACSDSGDELNSEIDPVILEDLIQHTDEFEKEVYSFENGLHLAVGYGIANSIMIEGTDAVIIVDGLIAWLKLEKFIRTFERSIQPIKAIIYTHNHGDHTFVPITII